MSAATLFLVFAVLLVVLVLAILLPPLWRAPKKATAIDRRAANLAIYRQQLAELERDRAAGMLAAADFAPAKAELQRRLLDEVQPEDIEAEVSGGVGGRKSERKSGRKSALALLILLPLAAVAGYALLGNPQGLAPAHTQGRMDAAQIDAMLARLAERLKANPDDQKGWIILARSYKALGRFADAADAYSHGGDLLANDAAQLADYAEVLVRANGGNFAGQPEKLLARALELDANEPQALFLAGAAANDRRDFAAVVDYWSRLLVQLEPGSEEAASLGEAVNKARKVLAQGGGKPGEPAASAAPAIGGEVSISDKIAAQAKPDDLLFVFARADTGSRMPLAVV
ncbi:MAG: c-type cytochrome biogenesis protein CcmI, partial [Propionivibrio sp.]